MTRPANLEHMNIDQDTSGVLMDDISTITSDISSEEGFKVIQQDADGLHNNLRKLKESGDVELCQAMKKSTRKYCQASIEATAEEITDRAADKTATTSSAKRKRESEDFIESTTSKKQKNPSTAEYISAPVLSVEQLCDPDMPLTFYTLERSCAAWNITHTTGILSLEKTKKDPRFELRDRRPFTAHAQDQGGYPMFTRSKGKADAKSFPSSETKFSKAAWPEISRSKEPAILYGTHHPVDELLQESFRSCVKDRIPTTDAWAELSDTSTVLIQCLICPILEPAWKLTPKTFWVAFCEAIRCHYLLWRIGIAHGDINLSNIMYNTVTKKCILNDYDLATLMDPSMEVPDRKGYEHKGTRPFMAFDLLKADGVAGHTERRYRHDLESFCWVLVWVGACVQGGQASVPSAYEAMVLGNDAQVRSTKAGLLMSTASYTTTEDYHVLENVIVDWIMWWCSFRGTMNKAVWEQRRHGIPVKEEPAEYFINAFVKTAADVAQPVPMEIDEVSAFLWTLYQEQEHRSLPLSLLGDSR